MERPPELLKGGPIRRGLALVVDLLVLQVLLQCLAVAAYPLSGGALIDLNSVFTSCEKSPPVPSGADLPTGFVPTTTSLCTKTLFGWPTARLFLASGQVANGGTTTVTYAVDPDGHLTHPFDLGGLQAAALVLMRWLLDRGGWSSLGRRLLSLRLMPRGLDEPLDRRTAVDHRFLLFGLPIVPGLATDVLTHVAEVLGRPVPVDAHAVLNVLATLPLTVATIVAVTAITRGRNAFYDEGARTTMARVVDGSVQIAPDRAGVRRGRLEFPGGRHEVRRVFPWLSCGLAAGLCAVYAAETLSTLASGHPVGVTGMNLVQFGGMSGELIRQVGQWYRLATSIVLHASAAHLLANVAVLLAAGWFLEGVFGRGMLLATFVGGGLVASLTSISLNAPNLVSVGASGAITAVVAAGLVVSLRLVDDASRLWLQGFCAACVLAALQATGKFAWGTVDHADHVGGAVGGGLIGLLVLILWTPRHARPPLQRAAPAVALAVVATLFVSVPWTGYGDVSMAALLVPADQLPRDDAEWTARSGDLVRRYPADPRTHLARALAAGDDQAERDRDLALAIAARQRLMPADGGRSEQSDDMIVGAARQAARDWTGAADLFGRAAAAAPSHASDALTKRAEVEEAQGLFDAALRDLRTVVDLRPKNAKTLLFLADVLFAKGFPREAVSTLDDALALAPDDPLILRERGWVGFFDRRGDAAVSDLERAASLQPKDAYAALWLDLVAERSGLPDRMKGHVKAIDMEAWPGPVVKLYLGDIGFDTVLDAAAAADSDPVKQAERRCEAEFYYGELQIMRHAGTEARSHLLAASTTCPKTFDEWAAVQAELSGSAGYRLEQP